MSESAETTEVCLWKTCTVCARYLPENSGRGPCHICAMCKCAACSAAAISRKVDHHVRTWCGDHLLREDWIRTIAEVNRVLVSGGYFLVCFANRDAFIKHLKTSELGVSWADQPEQFCEYGYVRTDTPAMMRAMLEAGGFKVVRESHCSEDNLRAGMLAVKR